MGDECILIDVAIAVVEGRRDSLVSLLLATVEGSSVEPGCVIYRATAALDDPLRFHILEVWDSEAAYLSHRAGAPLARFLSDLPGCGRVESIVRHKGALAPYGSAS